MSNPLTAICAGIFIVSLLATLAFLIMTFVGGRGRGGHGSDMPQQIININPQSQTNGDERVIFYVVIILMVIGVLVALSLNAVS
jgi:hypothetical protein